MRVTIYQTMQACQTEGRPGSPAGACMSRLPGSRRCPHVYLLLAPTCTSDARVPAGRVITALMSWLVCVQL